MVVGHLSLSAALSVVMYSPGYRWSTGVLASLTPDELELTPSTGQWSPRGQQRQTELERPWGSLGKVRR